MRRLLLLAVVGCGRMHFDPVADAGDASVAARCDSSAPFSSVRLLDDLSSPSLDGGLRMNPDELTAYFHSTRAGTSSLFVATRSSRTVPFDPPVSLGIMDAFWPSVSIDGRTLLYSRDDQTGALEDIYAAARASVTSPFPMATKLAAVNTLAVETSAQLGGSGTTLYFSRDEGVAQNIYVTSWPELTPARSLTELARPVMHPVISADELALYVTAGMAGLSGEIFVSRRELAGDPFGPLMHVPEVGSTQVDNATWVSPDNCRLYFESDRVAPTEYNLYIAEREP